MEMDKKLAKLIADNIIDDMCGRSGGDHWFESCDKEIQKEIRNEWADIIYNFSRHDVKRDSQ